MQLSMMEERAVNDRALKTLYPQPARIEASIATDYLDYTYCPQMMMVARTTFESRLNLCCYFVVACNANMQIWLLTDSKVRTDDAYQRW